MVDDNEFAGYAAEVEAQEAAQREARTNGGGARTYEAIKWTGLVPNRPKIIRVIGGVPGSPNSTAFTSRITQVGWIKGDTGKNFRCVLPTRDGDGKDHLMWRIISRVNEVAYINRKRIYVNEAKHKEIFDLVNFNGYVEGDQKRKYDKGWEGRQVVVMNVIDREQMDWHRENKHTMLLSRNIGLSKDGTREYPEEGVPVYGFFNIIATQLFKNYGNWEGYDIGITRLGTTQQPYRLINASAYAAAGLPELPKEMFPFVSLDKTLTDEERTWEQYDLSKIFNVTSFTKIYNNLHIAIQRIDATLGTQFCKELEFEVEKEKAARAAAKEAAGEAEPAKIEAEAPVTAPVATPSTPPAPAPAPATVRRTVSAATSTIKITADKIAALQGWNDLTDAQKAMIADVTLDKTGKAIDVKYDTDEGVLGCPQCRIPAPESFSTCPSCNTKF